MKRKTVSSWLGLILVSAGAIIGPFGYWAHNDYRVYGIFLLAAGVCLFVYGLAAREKKKIIGDDSDIYPSNDLRGFRGSDMTDDLDD